MRQYDFKIYLKGVGASLGQAWEDALDKFQLDPRYTSYSDSSTGQEIAIVDIHGNILGEGFLVKIPIEEIIEVQDSDIVEEWMDVRLEELEDMNNV